MIDALDPELAPPASSSVEHLDVLIVGAGLSGIGAAVHLQRKLPTKRYAIIEARQDLGGTWDLFRYPGIRSDSDMYTLGYHFKPWTGEKSIADGASIKAYIAETAVENGSDRHIRYGHRVVSADWSSTDARWTVTVAHGDETRRITCGFLMMCSGYYSYTDPHRPSWPGEERFAGTLVHPQFWPDDLDHAGKRVVVIGSGATAVTLIPQLAQTAAHVTMLQRSPTYIASRPMVDPFAERMKRWFPAPIAYRLTRAKNVLASISTYALARRRPALVKKALLTRAQEALGPDYDVGEHFTPSYDPWDQRLCAVPDGDLFEAIRSHRASVVTDTIHKFTERGIVLTSGREMQADIVVVATGLTMNVLGDVHFRVDGTPVDLSKALTYRGCMFSGVPNLATIFGYTNASWTLKADLINDYICRVLKRMDRRDMPIVTPHRDPSVEEEPFADLDSGYIRRAAAILPKRGSKYPWNVHQNYLRDLASYRLSRIDDGVLRFSSASARS